MQPHEYPRRILLCVSGNSPQIITETLYALAVETDGRPPFVPTEIRVLTTSRGAEQTRLSLLAEDRAKLRELCRDHGLSGIHFDDACIEVFKRTDGSPLADIVTPEDNRDAADHITRRVAELTGDDASAIHASIAGGRKTMGFYLGYAMSLFGREQDRVSHVLVSEGFTDHRDFFFKPKAPVTLRNAQGWEMSTADARIHLAEIPIVRLRGTEFAALSDRKLGFADAVARTSQLAAGTQLRLRIDRALGRNAGRGIVTLNGLPLRLSQSQAVLLHWLARHRLEGAKHGEDGCVSRNAFAYDRNTAKGMGYVNEILGLASQLYGEHSDAAAKVKGSLIGDANSDSACEDPTKWLDQTMGGITRCIKSTFGTEGLKRYGIEKIGKKDSYKYRLAIDPSNLHLEE